MLARVRSAAVLGIDAYLVDVEADLANGLPAFNTVGLPQGAVKEGRERVNAAITHAGFTSPLKRITINLAPADIKKDGCGFDLPIAIAILIASEQLPPEALDGMLLLGELGLEGDLRPVRGAISVALAARAAGLRGLILPAANAPEAAAVEGLEVYGGTTLRTCRRAPLRLRRRFRSAAAIRPRCSPSRSGRWWTLPKSEASPRPSGRWRSRRPAVTTSC